MDMNTKKIIGLVLLGVVVIAGVGFLIWTRIHQRPDTSIALQSDMKEMGDTATVSAAVELPQGVRIPFQDMPDCGIIKGHEGIVYTYTFFCQETAFGSVAMTGDWHVTQFLSYQGGERLFGFFPDRSGENGKYYWGPSILYSVNIDKRLFGKLIDISFSEKLGGEQANHSWGSNYFITDVSSDGGQVVYCNYFSKNAIFIRNIRTGETKEFPVDASLYDFGDATFSNDGTKIAFAGIKGKTTDGNKSFIFAEAELFVLDIVTGKITTKETQKKFGMYGINGWDGDAIDFEYLSF